MRAAPLIQSEIGSLAWTSPVGGLGSHLGLHAVSSMGLNLNTSTVAAKAEDEELVEGASFCCPASPQLLSASGQLPLGGPSAPRDLLALEEMERWWDQQVKTEEDIKPMVHEPDNCSIAAASTPAQQASILVEQRASRGPQAGQGNTTLKQSTAPAAAVNSFPAAAAPATCMAAPWPEPIKPTPQPAQLTRACTSAGDEVQDSNLRRSKRLRTAPAQPAPVPARRQRVDPDTPMLPCATSCTAIETTPSPSPCPSSACLPLVEPDATASCTPGTHECDVPTPMHVSRSRARHASAGTAMDCGMGAVVTPTAATLAAASRVVAMAVVHMYTSTPPPPAVVGATPTPSPPPCTMELPPLPSVDTHTSPISTTPAVVAVTPAVEVPAVANGSGPHTCVACKERGAPARRRFNCTACRAQEERPGKIFGNCCCGKLLLECAHFHHIKQKKCKPATATDPTFTRLATGETTGIACLHCQALFPASHFRRNAHGKPVHMQCNH